MCVCVSARVQQPSSDIFFRFDQLLLLQTGGHTVFFGDIRNNAVALVEYLAPLASDLPKTGVNPATWMLELLGRWPTGVVALVLLYC